METAVENGMLGDLYDIMTHTSDGTLCKVIQILAELGKTGTMTRTLRYLIFQSFKANLGALRGGF